MKMEETDKVVMPSLIPILSNIEYTLKKSYLVRDQETVEMAEQLLRTNQELRPLASDLYEQEEQIEEPFFGEVDGQGPPSDPDEDEEDKGGVEEDGKGDGPPVPPQPQ